MPKTTRTPFMRTVAAMRTQESASPAYRRNLAEFDTKITELKSLVRGHARRQKRHPYDWDFHSDLEHVLDNLNDAIDELLEAEIDEEQERNQ